MVYDLEALRQECQQGQRYKFLFFWGHQPQADGSIGEGCLSQWWPCRFTVRGVEYTCAEQYMMAEKARLFGDRENLEAILKAAHPKEMKALGRAVRNFDPEVWESRCYQLVLQGNLEKFRQNSELLEFLLGTGQRILVEASPRDCIWGIGMGRQNQAAEDPMKWRGRNLLGFALTQARDILREETQRN